MGATSLKFSERKTKTSNGRKTHKVKVCAGNGEPLLISPPKQAYYNKPELIDALRISKDALITFFEQYDK